MTEREFGSLARRRKRGAVVATVALIAILALAAILYSLSGGSVPETAENAALQTEARETIRVPDLSGLTYAEAETRLNEAGLVLEERESREGEVVGQNPEPGEEANDGDTVSVTLDDAADAAGERESGASPGAAQYGEDVFEYSE